VNHTRQIQDDGPSWWVTDDNGSSVLVVVLPVGTGVLDFSQFPKSYRDVYRENLPLREVNFRIATFLVTDDFGKTVVVQHHVNEFGYYKLLTHV
jgi:hypothetical protein